MEIKEKDVFTSREFREQLNGGYIVVGKKGRLQFKKNILTDIQPKIVEGNKKIRNATRTVIDNISYDSQLEAKVILALKEKGFNPSVKETLQLVNSFSYQGKTIAGVKWIPDVCLWDLGIIIDAKGYSNDTFPMKLRLAKRWLISNGKESVDIWTIKKESELTLLLWLLSERKSGHAPHDEEKQFKV